MEFGDLLFGSAENIEVASGVAAPGTQNLSGAFVSTGA